MGCEPLLHQVSGVTIGERSPCVARWLSGANPFNYCVPEELIELNECRFVFRHVPHEGFSTMRQFIMLFVQQCIDFLESEFRLPLPVQKRSPSQVRIIQSPH